MNFSVKHLWIRANGLQDNSTSIARVVSVQLLVQNLLHICSRSSHALSIIKQLNIFHHTPLLVTTLVIIFCVLYYLLPEDRIILKFKQELNNIIIQVDISQGTRTIWWQLTHKVYHILHYWSSPHEEDNSETYDHLKYFCKIFWWSSNKSATTKQQKYSAQVSNIYDSCNYMDWKYLCAKNRDE